MKNLFIKACKDETASKTIKIPIEPSGIVNYNMLQALYPGATGLKFKLNDANWIKYVIFFFLLIYNKKKLH